MLRFLTTGIIGRKPTLAENFAEDTENKEGDQ